MIVDVLEVFVDKIIRFLIISHKHGLQNYLTKAKKIINKNTEYVYTCDMKLRVPTIISKMILKYVVLIWYAKILNEQLLIPAPPTKLNTNRKG